MQAQSESLPQWIELVGALGPVLVGVASVVLSLALAFLYNEQKKLQEASHKAALDVINWEWDGDSLEVDVVNHGKGVAQDMALTTLAHADNGAHRKYTVRSNVLKRGSQGNPWANAVEANGEVHRLTGERKLGVLAPAAYPRDWTGISFENFLQEMKVKGVKELKYCFVVQGVELTNRRAWTLLRHEMMITNPQEYSREDGIGPVTQTSHDGTFNRYFSTSFLTRWSNYLYIQSLQALSKIPVLGLQPRGLDASGTRRVKRLLLRRRVAQSFKTLMRRKQNDSENES